MKQITMSLFSSLIFLTIGIIGCKENIAGADSTGSYRFCYEKENVDNWDIFINDATGSSAVQITSYNRADEYPRWSPDGRYIVFSRHSTSGTSPLIIVYDVKNKAEHDLTLDGGGASQQPQWLPNGQLCFGYPFFGAPRSGTYIMNADGSSKKKILDSATTYSTKAIYFYPDSYTFVYVIDWQNIFKTNIDGTFTESLGSLSQILNQQAVAQDFNPLTEEVLFTYMANGVNAIGTYSLATKSLTTKLAAETGYTFFQVKYSRDFSKIVYIEHSDNDEYLSVLENGMKKRLVQIPKQTPRTYFSYHPMEFSPDGKYIAYSRQIFLSGQWVRFKDELHLVNVLTAEDQYIDDGHSPSWNPKL